MNATGISNPPKNTLHTSVCLPFFPAFIGWSCWRDSAWTGFVNHKSASRKQHGPRRLRCSSKSRGLSKDGASACSMASYAAPIQGVVSNSMYP